ncbi:MAG: hypothetical protein WC378_00900 [Opitutaceae bacterium]
MALTAAFTKIGVGAAAKWTTNLVLDGDALREALSIDAEVQRDLVNVPLMAEISCDIAIPREIAKSKRLDVVLENPVYRGFETPQSATLPPFPELGLIPLTVAFVAESVASSSFVHFGPCGLVPASASQNRPANGFVRQATSAGGSVAVYGSGVLNGLSGLLTSMPYWLGEYGQVTGTPPVVGISQSLGVASAPDSLVVSISDPIFLTT